jgi:hypothetical protein
MDIELLFPSLFGSTKKLIEDTDFQLLFVDVLIMHRKSLPKHILKKLPWYVRARLVMLYEKRKAFYDLKKWKE